MDLIILLVLLGLMYAVLILPQQRRMRRHRELLGTLEVGDEVGTSSGIYGRIVGIEGDLVQVEVAEGVVLNMAKGSISEVAIEEEDDEVVDEDVDE